MARKPEVLEMDEGMGIFTVGIDSLCDAYNAMLDWYHTESSRPAGRLYIVDHLGISESVFDPEHIKEAEMMRCNGEECGGKWWLDDTECYDCERSLDKRTKTKTFYLYF